MRLNYRLSHMQHDGLQECRIMHIASSNTVVFVLGNSIDGKVSTFNDNEARCTMFFAVYVTEKKKAVYGMNFDKPGIKILCLP